MFLLDRNEITWRANEDDFCISCLDVIFPLELRFLESQISKISCTVLRFAKIKRANKFNMSIKYLRQICELLVRNVIAWREN